MRDVDFALAQPTKQFARIRGFQFTGEHRCQIESHAESRELTLGDGTPLGFVDIRIASPEPAAQFGAAAG